MFCIIGKVQKVNMWSGRGLRTQKLYKKLEKRLVSCENSRFYWSEWGDSANQGVAAIELAASNSPLDCCIWSFESPPSIGKEKPHTAYGGMWFLVRVGRFELPASWTQTAREDFFTSKTAVLLCFTTKTELFNNDNSVDSDRNFSGSGQICGQKCGKVERFCSTFFAECTWSIP